MIVNPQCSSNRHEHPRAQPGKKTTNPVTATKESDENHHRSNKGWSRPQPCHAPQSLGNRMPDPFDKVMDNDKNDDTATSADKPHLEGKRLHDKKPHPSNGCKDQDCSDRQNPYAQKWK